MPKIGTRLEKIKEQCVELVIWYTRDGGFSYKNLPSDFTNVTGFRNGGYESENALLGAFRKSLSDYHEQMKQTKKVIRYYLKGSTEMLMNKTGEHSYSGKKHGVSDKFSTFEGGGYSFGFNYSVIMETSGTDKKRHYQLNEDGSIGRELYINNDGRNIDWSPEREQFFKDMVDNLQRLVYGVSAFFDKPDMLQLMDMRGFKAIE